MNTSIYLQLISLNKTKNNHFLKRYVKLVSFYKERNWSEQFGFHEHHIIPESFGGPDTVDNLVFITIREHFILHWMLYKAFPKSQMTTAFHMMCNCSGQKVSSKVYEKLLLEFIERQRENVNKIITEGKHHWQGDGELQRAIQNKLVAEGRHHWQDKEKAREQQNKLVLEGKHNWQGDGEQQRERAKKRVEDGEHNFLGKNQIQIECKHCKRTFNEGNYNQWHGDNCKLNPLFKNEKIKCEHCNRFFSKNTFTRYHGDKCKLKPQI